MKGLKRHDFFCGTLHLPSVPVDDEDHVVKTKVGRSHNGFPENPFLEFTIAYETVDLRGESPSLQGKSHAVSETESVAERTAGSIHARGTPDFRKALQHGAKAAIAPQLLPGKETSVRQNGVESGTTVSLAEDESVPFLPDGILGSKGEYLPIQPHENIHNGHRRGEVARTGHSNHTHHVPADRQCVVSEKILFRGHEERLPFLFKNR